MIPATEERIKPTPIWINIAPHVTKDLLKSNEIPIDSGDIVLTRERGHSSDFATNRLSRVTSLGRAPTGGCLSRSSQMH